MARKYVNPNRAWDELARQAVHTRMRPGSWRAALYDDEAPGAQLNPMPWASGWGPFLAAVRGNERAQTAIRNAMAERVPSEGGFLVPEFLRSEIFSYLESAIVRPRAQVFPMRTLRLPLPALDNVDQSGAAGALGGMAFSVVSDGEAIPASVIGLRRVVLEARKLAGLLQDVPNELSDDSGQTWEQLVGPVIGKGYAFWEDHLFVTGTGVGQPEGALNAACRVDVTRAGAGAVALADVAAMRKRLHPASARSRSAVWLANSDVVAQLAELSVAATGTAGTVPVATLGLSTGPDGTLRLAGLEVVETSHASALGTRGDLILADFSVFAVGDRQMLTVDRSELGAGFAADTSDWKIVARVDGRWLVTEPVTPENGATVSPVVVLN